jgi:regulator of sirC expression with transglutaminase-like and TPR domain
MTAPPDPRTVPPSAPCARPSQAPRAAAGTQRVAEALVALLPDDSSAVRAALARLGKAAVPALRAAARHGAPELRGRARTELLVRDRRAAAARLAGFVLGCNGRTRGGELLERGLLLLDRFLDPRLDPRAERRQMDAWAEDVAARVAAPTGAFASSGTRRARALVEVLAGEAGLVGNSADYHHTDGVSLTRTIIRRTGLPLTLCAVYQAVARRAGVEATLLPFPGHVLLGMNDGSERLIVDAFGGGKILSPRQCLARLAEQGAQYRERWLAPASDRDMLARQVHNLDHSLVQRGRMGEHRLLECVLEAFSTPLPRSQRP